MKKYLMIILIVGLLIGFGIGFSIKKCPITADINRDGKVDILDFNILMRDWTK